MIIRIHFGKTLQQMSLSNKYASQTKGSRDSFISVFKEIFAQIFVYNTSIGKKRLEGALNFSSCVRFLGNFSHQAVA